MSAPLVSVAGIATALIVATAIFVMIAGDWFLRRSFIARTIAVIAWVAVFLGLALVERVVMP